MRSSILAVLFWYAPDTRYKIEIGPARLRELTYPAAGCKCNPDGELNWLS
jgi:hypothetical protein